MVIEEIKQIKSGRKELRDFGIVMGIALLVIFAIFHFRHQTLYFFLLYASAALLIAGMVIPTVLLPLQKVWMAMAISIGWVVSRIILSILFYVIFTITGLAGRLFSKHFLDIKLKRDEESYWIPRAEKKEVNYEKQF
jgi:uncharacterized membrane protein